jgi:ribosomal protein S18 acetylase RimI-like enzyme
MIFNVCTGLRYRGLNNMIKLFSYLFKKFPRYAYNLEVYKINIPAQNLYKKLGFEQTSEFSDYYIYTKN